MADLRKLKDDATQALTKGKFAKAVELFDELSRADPKDYQAQIKLGDALVKAGNRPRALAVYQKCAESYANEGFLPKAIALCKVILELDPKHNATQQVLAGLYAKKLGTDPAPRRPAAPPAQVPIAPVVAPVPAPAPAAEIELVDAADVIELDTADHAQGGFGPPPLPAKAEPEALPEELSTPLELDIELSPAAAARAGLAASQLVLGEEPPAEPAPSSPQTARPTTRPPPPEAWGPNADSISAQLETAVEEPAGSGPGDTDIEIVFDVPLADSAEEEIEILSVTAEIPRGLGRPLPKIPLFSDLTPEAFVALTETCGFIRADAGQVIVRQGDAGNSFFVVCSGKMKVVKKDQDGQEIVMAYLAEGAFFGEMALLSGLKRTATVIADEESELLEISAPVLNNLARQYPYVAASLRQFGRQRLLADVMATSALFRPFDRAERKKLVELFKVREVQAGEVVVTEGTPTDGLYLVMNGELEVKTRGPEGRVLASMHEGDIFGEMSLLSKKAASASVTAKRRSNVLRLPRERFEELVVTYPQVLVLVSELADARTRSDAKVVLAPDPGSPVV